MRRSSARIRSDSAQITHYAFIIPRLKQKSNSENGQMVFKTQNPPLFDCCFCAYITTPPSKKPLHCSNITILTTGRRLSFFTIVLRLLRFLSHTEKCSVLRSRNDREKDRSHIDNKRKTCYNFTCFVFILVYGNIFLLRIRSFTYVLGLFDFDFICPFHDRGCNLYQKPLRLCQ